MEQISLQLVVTGAWEKSNHLRLRPGDRIIAYWGKQQEDMAEVLSLFD